jgi:uncharacterized RDD family membrane protein YckC
MTQPHEPDIPPPPPGNLPPSEGFPPPGNPPPSDGFPPPAPTGGGYAYEQPPPAGPYATPQPPPGAYGYEQPGLGVQPPGAGLVPAGMYIDPVSGLALPQGVELASVGRRIGAYFLAIPLAIVTLFIGYVIWGLIVWANGQTPALQVLGMRCWRPETGRVAGWWWMALREIVGRVAEGILSFITLLLSLILMLTRPDRRSLHDLLAGTVVLRDPNKVLSQ